MSRAAIFQALAHDSALNLLGITEDSIFPNYSLDERPVNDGPFLILRWGAGNGRFWDSVKSPRGLNVWAHYPVEVTTDHVEVDKVLNRVDSVLLSLEQVSGEDGETLTSVRSTGSSPDMKDEGFQTISRYNSYDILSRNS